MRSTAAVTYLRTVVLSMASMESMVSIESALNGKVLPMLGSGSVGTKFTVYRGGLRHFYGSSPIRFLQ